MEDFGRSVKFFPLVGAVLGGIYALAAALLVIWLPQMGCQVPHHLAMAVLLLLPVCLTGGLHTDGFMDTMDGILSGRSRERMLEIMKDSRTGSMGVTAFVLLLLLEWAILLDMDAQGRQVSKSRMQRKTTVTVYMIRIVCVIWTGESA